MRFNNSNGLAIAIFLVVVTAVLTVQFIANVNLSSILWSILIAIIVGFYALLEVSNDILITKHQISIENVFRFWSPEINFEFSSISYVEVRSTGQVPVIEIHRVEEEHKFACIGLTNDDQKKIIKLLNDNNVNAKHFTWN